MILRIVRLKTQSRHCLGQWRLKRAPMAIWSQNEKIVSFAKCFDMKSTGFRRDKGFRIFVEKRLPHQVRAGYAQCGLNRNQGIALTGGVCFPGPRKGRFKHTLLRRLEKVDLKALGFRRDGRSRNPKFGCLPKPLQKRTVWWSFW